MYLGYAMWGIFNVQSAMAMATVNAQIMCNPLAVVGLSNIYGQAFAKAAMNGFLPLK